MSLQQLRLMHRTAWMNDRLERNPALRPPKKSDRDDLITAFYMLAYLGAIDMALFDLIDELQDANLYRHNVKNIINRIVKVVGDANGLASTILREINGGVIVKQHSDMYEFTYNQVQEHISIEPPHRAYSIIKAMSRLFVDAYNKVGAKTNHYYLKDAANILPRLDIPQLKDYKIDFIISRCIQLEIAETK